MLRSHAVNPSAYSHPSPPPSEDDLFGWRTIAHWVGFVLRAPRRHKLLAAGSFLAIFLLACGALYTIPFQYQVQATLLAGYQQAGALSNPMERGTDAPTRAARELLLRRENLREILVRTNFVEKASEKRPWAVALKDSIFEAIRGRPRAPDEMIDGMIDTLSDRLWVDVHPEGTLDITFRWWDAELARQIVDAAQTSFLESRRASEVDAVGEAIAILETQQAQLDKDIAAAIEDFEKKQEQLRNSPAAKPAAAPRPVSQGPDPEIARLQRELATKQRLLAEMEGARLDRISRLQSELVQQQSVYAASHPTIASTRRALASLAAPEPKAVELRSDIETLERDIAQRGGKPARTIVSEPYLAARLRLDSDDPRLEFERGRVENLLRQHADLRNRIQGVKVEQELAEAAFSHRYRVVAPARLPRGPIKPYPVIFLAGGLLGGLAFAFFAAAVADFRSGRIIERWQIEHHLGLPVLIELRRDSDE